MSLRDMFHLRFPLNENGLDIKAPVYRCLSNTPEDILEATKEMLHLVDTDSFGGPMTKEQELFHQYRMEALEAGGSLPAARRDMSFADLHQARSRISSTYVARYFPHEQSENIGANPANRG